MTDTPDAAALRARVAYAIGETRIAAEEEPLQYVLLRGFSALGWAQPSNAAVDMTEAAARAALSAVPRDAVFVPRDVAVQITEKLRTIARAFPGDKQTRDTLLPAMIAAAERGDAEGGA